MSTFLPSGGVWQLVPALVRESLSLWKVSPLVASARLTGSRTRGRQRAALPSVFGREHVPPSPEPAALGRSAQSQDAGGPGLRGPSPCLDPGDPGAVSVPPSDPSAGPSWRGVWGLPLVAGAVRRLQDSTASQMLDPLPHGPIREAAFDLSWHGREPLFK